MARPLLWLLPAILLASAPLIAQELTVKIVDQNGEPLADAVVEVRQQPRRSPATDNAVIDQIDRRFVPTVIAIHPGQAVEFPNSDNVRHHVYSFSEIRRFSTRLYADEPVEPVHFDTPGIATLGCNIHDSMVAYVYVSEWQHVAVSDEEGQVRLQDLAQTPDTLHIWHPWLNDAGNRREIRLSSGSTDDGTTTITLEVTAPSRESGFGALTGEDS